MLCIANRSVRKLHTYENIVDQENNSTRIEIPKLFYTFLEQFMEPVSYALAKNKFVECGLPEELFVETIEILIEENLIDLVST